MLARLQETYAKTMFSLQAYCETYGKISDSVVLADVSEEFEDWHMNVTLDDEEMKILCCPEDVQCASLESNLHRKDECCGDCVVSVCHECSSHLQYQ